MELVRNIIRSKHKITLKFPQPGTSPVLVCFGKGELSEILSFGFSYIEQADHCVDYLIVTPKTAKKIVQEIDAFYFTSETFYVGILWTAKVIITNRVDDSSIVFSNADQSVVLNLNNMEANDAHV